MRKDTCTLFPAFFAAKQTENVLFPFFLRDMPKEFSPAFEGVIGMAFHVKPNRRLGLDA
jgi:hypothetical protein